MTREELDNLLADRDWWKKLETMLGWRLIGWTKRESATFQTGVAKCLQLNGDERNSIAKLRKR